MRDFWPGILRATRKQFPKLKLMMREKAIIRRFTSGLNSATLMSFSVCWEGTPRRVFTP